MSIPSNDTTIHVKCSCQLFNLYKLIEGDFVSCHALNLEVEDLGNMTLRPDGRAMRTWIPGQNELPIYHSNIVKFVLVTLLTLVLFIDGTLSTCHGSLKLMLGETA